MGSQRYCYMKERRWRAWRLYIVASYVQRCSSDLGLCSSFFSRRYEMKENGMFETGIRQFQMAMAMVWGKPIHPRTMERLIEDALKTLKEFGTPGDDVQQLLEGPFSDPSARREFQNRALQRTLQRLMRFSPYYHKRLASLGIEAGKLSVEDMPRLPMTRKEALVEQQQDFITTDSHPYITSRTTGTTGRPAEIWFSKYEMELWPALAAL